MPDITIGVNRDLRGGLDSDTDIQNLAGGNYPDCVNVERNNSGIGGADAPSDGNAIEYTITELQKQSQKVRVFNNLIDFQGNQYNYIRMSLFNGNGFLIRNTYIKNTDYVINTFAGIKDAVEIILASPIWNTGLSQGSITESNLSGDANYPEGYFDVLFPFEYDTYTFELVAGFGDLGNLRIRPFSSSLRPGNFTGLTLGDAVSSGLLVLETVNAGTPISTENIEFTPIQIRIIEEAYSESAAGKPHLIGSKENNSKLFMCWTTKTKDRSKINTGNNLEMYINLGLGDGADKLWVNTFPVTHRLVDYQSVIMANISSPFSSYNGTWVIRVVDEYTFYLASSNHQIGPDIPNVPTPATADIFTNVDGVSLFVVQSYDVQSNTYTYEIPLKSKQLNWDTKHQIDLDVEFFNNVYSLYYNDFLNRPRVTYFNDPIGTDSAIEAINPTAQYDYAILADQVVLQQNNNSNIQITILDQVQGGGSLFSGSYRYGVVLVTDSETETEISELSGLVRVYPPIYEEGAMIYGDYGNSAIFAATSKINKIRVDGIPAGVFKYIDLICVIIDGSDNTTLTSTQTLVVSRNLLGPDDVSINLDHSGNEIDIRSFSLGSINPIKETILKAYNNVIGENRLLISNFTTTQSIDISEWVDTFKYSIKRQGVYSDALGENYLGFASPSQDYGGVEAPVGYQLYEWYRFYVVAEYIEGGFTDAFFCFDVRFVTQGDYTNSIGTDDDFSFPTTNGYDRRDLNGDELTSYHLTESSDGGRFRYQWGIELKNIDWDYSIEGVKIRNLVKKVFVYRAERIDEVLASGYITMSVKKSIVDFTPTGFDSPNSIDTSPTIRMDYPYAIKQNSVFGSAGFVADSQNQKYSDQGNVADRRFGAFYSTDYLFNPSLFSFVIGDELAVLSLGNPVFTDRFFSGSIGQNNEDNYLRIFAHAQDTSLSFATKRKVEEFKFIGTNEESTIGGTFTYTKKRPPDTSFQYTQVYVTDAIGSFPRQPQEAQYGSNVESPVFDCGDGSSIPFFPSLRDFDYGVYYGVHFRKKENKYGLRAANNNVLSTNYIVNNGESSKTVFGGDVYTQGTSVKKQYFSDYDGSSSAKARGGSAAWIMVTQNRINTQLRTLNPDLPNRIYPQQIPNWPTWAVKSLNEQEYFSANSGYLEVKNQQLAPAFDPELLTRTAFPTRIIYSEIKPNGSVKDFYRLFPPGQFRDNPNNFGAITHMDIKQGELFTLQELCYTREFLNSTGQLSTIDSGQVIIGDASVLSRPGVRLTSLGSKHKWSYARGLTDAGTDVRCWVNSDFFVVLRAGRDGTVNLTERSLMDTFLRENMRFVRDKFTPADGQGIHAIWDDVGKNFVITVRGWRDNVEWSTNASRYFTGTVVRYKEQYGVPILYVALVNIAFQEELQIPPDQPEAAGLWQKIEFTNTNYYSLFTICFNEARNRFTHFNTFYPKIYANHFDRFFSPKPHIDESNKFYLMRQGEALVFYDEEHEGYTEYVINQEPSMLKKFVSIAYNAILKPLRVEFKTQFISEQGIEERVTSLDRSELKIRENIVYSTIKNTLDENGQNNQRTAPMKGMWLRIKTFFKAKENQKINDIFVPIRMGQRNVKNP
jgi:hypothetical protein